MTEAAAVPEKGRTRTTIAIIAAAAAALAIPISAFGRMLGLWQPPLIMLGVAFLVTVVGLILAIILGLIGVLRRKDRPWTAYQVRGSLLALVVGVIVAVPVGSFIVTGTKYPPIHDHTTDPDNPPRFVALLAERENPRSNPEEPNPKIIPQQKAGFPDLKPVQMPVGAPEAFTRALDAAKAMGWRIAAAVPEEGRIEAVDTTFWSGFIDDVVIRITPVDDTHSILDVRSLSRVGGGDVGKNGLRIREYLAVLKK